VQLPPEKVLAAQQTILGDPKITKVAHNSKFERHMARVDGLRVRGEVVDTMVAAHLYKSTELIGLKERLIADVGDHAAAELKDTLQQDIRRLAKWRGLGVKAYRASYGYTELDQWLIQPYGCADALGALKLFNHYDSIGVRSYYSKPRRGPQYLSLWETEMALTEVFSHMEHIGQPLDLDYLKHLHVYMEMEKEKAEAAFFSTFHVQKFNLGSDDEIRQFLQKGLKVRLVKKTNKGAMAVDADVLLDLESSYPGLGHLLRWKDCEKKASTYTIALAARADQHGILHADFQSVGTVTGRVSCKEPNLQNVASDDAARAKAAGGVDPESIKRAFIVPRKTADPYMQWVQKHRGPGVQLVRQFWDLSQVELRVIAHYTREPRMLQVYAEDGDIHEATENAVFGTGKSTPHGDINRRYAKNLNFGMAYGLGPAGFSRQVKGITLERAEQIYTEFRQKFGQIWRYKAQFLGWVRANGCRFDNMFGRTRYVPDLISEERDLRARAEREAFSTLIQGTAAELSKVAMVLIDRDLRARGLESRLTQMVHDELQIDGPLEEEREVSKIVLHRMTDFPDFVVPIRVEAKRSVTHWSDKSTIDQGDL
jgi:DNA polymerase-1